MARMPADIRDQDASLREFTRTLADEVAVICGPQQAMKDLRRLGAEATTDVERIVTNAAVERLAEIVPTGGVC